MCNSIIGLDIAKNVFHLVTLQSNGKTMKKKLKRAEILTFFATYPASVIGMEACGRRSSLGKRAYHAGS
ncbi:MAG: hypothetical protein PHG00_00010 [Methylococcales bacterium]|nr:hypothetical protein [Methylococcales bacterium]